MITYNNNNNNNNNVFIWYYSKYIKKSAKEIWRDTRLSGSRGVEVEEAQGRVDLAVIGAESD